MSIPQEGLPQSAVELSLAAVKYRHTPIYQFFIELNQRIAMLHPDVLALLHYIGANATFPILELGPYIGGSTIAMAKGIASGDRSLKITTVEKGEGYVHEKLTTTDIITSLRDNLLRHEVEDRVNIVVGHSRDQAIVQQVAEHAKTTKFGCMVMDADGRVDDDLRCYGSLLRNGHTWWSMTITLPALPKRKPVRGSRSTKRSARHGRSVRRARMGYVVREVPLAMCGIAGFLSVQQLLSTPRRASKCCGKWPRAGAQRAR